VLKHAVGIETLNEQQLIAGDVDGSGVVNEYDASLILQMTVKKLDAFPCGQRWKFVPEKKDVTLSPASAANVTFIAIYVGDVDGSYVDVINGGGEQ